MKNFPSSDFNLATDPAKKLVMPKQLPAEYYLSWVGVAIGLPCMHVVLRLTGLDLKLSGALALMPVLVALILVHLYYTAIKFEPMFSALTGSLGVLLSLALPWGVLCNAGLRLQLPLIDQYLVASDTFMGVNSSTIVLFVASNHFLGKVLASIYVNTFTVLLVTILFLGLSGKYSRLWELVWGYTGCLVAISLISVAFPAVGNVNYSGLAGNIANKLPDGSGTYFNDAFVHFRYGIDTTVDATKLGGVANFPSFHGVMAIIIAYAYRRLRVIGWIAFAWCGLILFSAIPIGGHYFSDLMGSLVLWASCMGSAYGINAYRKSPVVPASCGRDPSVTLVYFDTRSSRG